MASKKQRRRKRQKAAAKARKEQENMVVQQKWRTYTVATRVAAKGGPVNVRTIKEFDEEQLFPFIMRLTEIKSLDELDVFDVHRDNVDGTIDILAELADWPPGSGTLRHKGEFVRGMGDTSLYLKTGTPAGTKPLVASTKKETVIVPPAVSFRVTPLKWYTTGILKEST